MKKKIKLILIILFSNSEFKNRSILEYAEEQIRLEAYWSNKRRSFLGCRTNYSSDAFKNFGINPETVSNALIGYIEYLQANQQQPTK